MTVFFLRTSTIGMLLFLVAFLVWPKTFLVGKPTTYALPFSSLPLPQIRPLVVTPPVPITSLERLELPLHPDQGTSHLESLNLEITPECSLSLAQPLEISGRTEVYLRPAGTGCSDVIPRQRYEGWVRTNSTVPLWVRTTRAGYRNMTLVDQSVPWALRALWVSKKGHGSRLANLAAMWDIPVWVLALGLVVSLIPAGIGLWLLSDSENSKQRIIITGLLALTPALTIALISPPFQAPDENNHFYSFAALNDNLTLLESGLELGSKGHFARIRSNKTEIFTPEDASSPSKDSMIMHSSHQVSSRSFLVSIYWRALGKLIPSSQANVVLWAVRWLNALVYGLAVFLGAWLVQRSAPHLRYPIFLFAVPALPFFAMHLSNHAFVPGLCVVMACLALGLIFKRGNWPLAGIVIGLICAVALLTARSLIGLVIGSMVLVSPVPFLAAGRSRKDSLYFWGGILAGLIPLFMAWNHPQVFDLVMVGRGVLERVLPHMTGLIAMVASPATIIMLVALAYGLERLLGKIYGRWGAPSWTFMRWTLLPLVIVFIVILCLGCGYDIFPGFRSIEEGRRPPLMVYFSRALYSFFTGFSPRKPTFLIQSSFWGGFAWLELTLPQMIVRVLSTMSGLGFVLFCIRIWKRKDGRQAIMLLTLLGAVIAALLATAFGAHSTLMNLHGRYILGVYLLFLAPAFAGFTPTKKAQTFPTRLAVSLGASMLVLVAAMGPWLLLERFFGCDTLYTLLGHRLG